MSIYKSRQVNLDPTPYIPARGGQQQMRSADPAPFGRPMIHDPRPEFEPTRDPHPYLVSAPVAGIPGAYYARERIADPGWKTFWDEEVERCEFRPRRAEFDTPVNPILIKFRAERDLHEERGLATAPLAALWLDQSYFQAEAGADQIEHAKKVLSRLAALS